MNMNKLQKDAEKAGNDFADSVAALSISTLHKVAISLLADKIMEMIIVMHIPVNVMVKALELLIVMLKKAPDYKEE